MASKYLDDDFFRTIQEWGADRNLTQRSSRAFMVTPALGVYFHHSVTVMTDENDSDPTDDADDDMKRIERARPDLGMYPYSWAAHPSGIIGEGQGFRIGAHTAGYNSRYFGFVGIGNYDKLVPSKIMLENMSRHLADLVVDGKLIRNFSVGGHRQVKATACPGGNLFPLIGDIRARTMDLLQSKPAPVPVPKPELILEDDMGKAYRFPDGKVWLCTATHREHVGPDELNGRAWMGLVARVPDNDPNKDSVHPMWVRKTNATGAAILSDLRISGPSL